MKRGYILILAALLMTAISCSKGEAYFKFKKIDKGEWQKDTLVLFKLDSLLVDPSSKYDLQLDIVYSSVYPYHDLCLAISHDIIDSTFVHDTLRVILVDEYGKRTGSGNAGLYQLSVPYKSDMILDSLLSYTVSVGHAMRDNKLKGIEKIGLKVSESH